VAQKFTVIAFVAITIAALSNAPTSAIADNSNGCAPQPRLSSGDYTETTPPFNKSPIQQLGSNGQTLGRTYYVHVPSQHILGPPLPLIIYLHGTGGEGKGESGGTGMRAKADTVGFILVAPNAWPWPDWTNFASDIVARQGYSDIEFVKMLLDVLDEALCFDRNQIYATGYSNGGIMSSTLARAGADGRLGGHRLAAIAPVASMPLVNQLNPAVASNQLPAARTLSGLAYVPRAVPPIELCVPSGPSALNSDPIPMHVFYGLTDRLVANGACYQSYNDTDNAVIHQFLCDTSACNSGTGCQGNVVSMVWVAQCFSRIWAMENGCSGAFKDNSNLGTAWGDPNTMRTFDCSQVRGGRGVTLVTIINTPDTPNVHPNTPEHPDGHIWPGSDRDGGTYKATDAIWDFFNMHRRH